VANFLDLSDYLYPDAAMGRQPQGPVAVDGEIPITRKVITCGFGDSPMDRVTGLNPTSNSLVQKSVSKVGSALIGTSVTGGANRNIYPLRESPAKGLTLVFFGTLGTTTAFNSQLGIFDNGLGAGSGSGIGIKTTSGGALRAFGYTSAGTNVQVTGATAVSNTPYALVVTWDGATIAFYVNGVLAGSAAMTTLYLTGNEVLNVGDFAVAGFMGAMAGWAYLAAALSAREVAAISTNPSLLYGAALNIPFAGSAGGSSVTLAASATAQDAATASLLNGVSLAGSALSVDSATAGMLHTVPLAASASAQASGFGQIALTISFSASAVAVATGTAAMALSKSLAAAAQSSDAATASLSTGAGGSNVSLGANATSSDTASATLALAVNLSAAAIAQAVATAGLGGSAALTAAAIANAQASSALAVGKPLSAAAQAQASAGTTLWLQVALSATALEQAAAGGSIKLVVNLNAAALSSGSATAALSGPVQLSADGESVATAAATLTVQPLMNVLKHSRSAADVRRNWSAPDTRRNWTAEDRRRNFTAADMEIL